MDKVLQYVMLSVFWKIFITIFFLPSEKKKKKTPPKSALSLGGLGAPAPPIKPRRD